LELIQKTENPCGTPSKEGGSQSSCHCPLRGSCSRSEWSRVGRRGENWVGVESCGKGELSEGEAIAVMQGGGTGEGEESGGVGAGNRLWEVEVYKVG